MATILTLTAGFFFGSITARLLTMPNLSELGQAVAIVMLIVSCLLISMGIYCYKNKITL